MTGNRRIEKEQHCNVEGAFLNITVLFFLSEGYGAKC